MKMYRQLVFVFSLLVFLFVSAPAAHAQSNPYEKVPYEKAAADTTHTMNALTPQISREQYLLQQAFTAGLQTVEAHQYTNTLTQQDQEIIQLMDVKIPGIMNRIDELIEATDETAAQTIGNEIDRDLTSACNELARKIIANQTLYPEPKDWQVASNYAMILAFTSASMTGKIDPEVSIILQEIFLQEMYQMYQQMQ